MKIGEPNLWGDLEGYRPDHFEHKTLFPMEAKLGVALLGRFSEATPDVHASEIATGASIITDSDHVEISPGNSDKTVPTGHPIWHCMVGGLIGGAVGDSSMHSLDTVKTRQQAAPYIAKYKGTVGAYKTIFLQEGFRRGLYGGYGAAMLGSIPSGVIFFGTYELVKRKFINDYHLNETFTHLFAGFLGDLATSFIYVPSEVLKTRLQLQGRYNNPFYNSGYNYKGLTDAIVTIGNKEGWRTFFSGYRATLFRDLPFSALQLAFYEKFRQLAFAIEGKYSKTSTIDDLSLKSEIATGAAAGGISGILTTPLDVFKTRLQTQNPASSKSPGIDFKVNTISSAIAKKPLPHSPITTQTKSYTIIPSTARPAILNTSSVFKGLYIVYQTEGILGLFSGVQPRFIWTSIQSSIMLLLYQQTLKGLSRLEDANNSKFT